MIMKYSDNKTHPDQHKIDDWFLYGPKNQEIEILVRELTTGHGLRLAEVESLIVEALRQSLLGH
jgi:hypothetical protein